MIPSQINQNSKFSLRHAFRPPSISLFLQLSFLQKLYKPPVLLTNLSELGIKFNLTVSKFAPTPCTCISSASLETHQQLEDWASFISQCRILTCYHRYNVSIKSYPLYHNSESFEPSLFLTGTQNDEKSLRGVNEL